MLANNLLVIGTFAMRPAQIEHEHAGPARRVDVGPPERRLRVFSADGVVAGLGQCEGSGEQAWLKKRIASRTAEVIVLSGRAKLGRHRSNTGDG